MKPFTIAILFFIVAGITLLTVLIMRHRLKEKPAKKKKALPRTLKSPPARSANKIDRRTKIIEWIKKDPEKVSRMIRHWMREEKL